MSRHLLVKLYANAAMYATAIGQRRVPYAPLAELHARRDARVRRIVKYAAETVPYYRELFQRERIRPADIRSAEDLARLPLLDGKTVRRDPERFRSTSRWGRLAVRLTTGGTTGNALCVYHDPRSLLANLAYGARNRAVWERHLGRRFGYRQLYMGFPGDWGLHRVLRAHDEWAIAPMRPRWHFVSVLEPVEEVARSINRLRPEILIGYGGFIEHFFRLVSARSIALALPRLVVYGGEPMTDAGKQFIEEEFGIPVYSHYSATEVFRLGFSCEERRGLHIHEDLCAVRIVGARGECLPPGESGEVVISNLVNHGTVLLNYRLGDVASLSPDRCACGRTLPLLSELEGRVQDIVFLPDGRFLHPRVIWRVVRAQPEVLRYQVVQHEPARFELRLVTRDEATYDRIAGEVARELRGILGSGVHVETAYHTELPAGSRGKFRMIVAYRLPTADVS